MRCTILSLLLFPFFAFPEDRALPVDYLKSLELSEGGYLPELKAAKPSLASTSSGVRVEKYLTGTIQNAEKHGAFVRSCLDAATGGFGPSPMSKADVASTAIALMAVAELGSESKETISRAVDFLAKNAKTFEERRISAGGFEAVKIIPDVSKEWIADLRKTKNQDGSYGEGPTKGRSTGGAIAFILRLGGELTPEERKGALAALREAQQSDGAFLGADGNATDLESTYRIMRAFYLLHEKPANLDKLKVYLSKCLNADGGYGRKPGEASSVSGCYYSASISKFIKALEMQK